MRRLVALLLLLATPAVAKPLPALKLVVPFLGDVVRAIPPASGASSGGSGGLTSPITSRVTFGTAADAASAIDIGEATGQITFEGATADAFETRFGVTDPTVGDQVFLLPNLATAGTDTIMTLASAQTVTGTKTHTGTVNLSAGQGIITIGSGGSNGAQIWVANSMTPDSPVIGTGALSNAWHFGEGADFYASGYDFQNCSAGTSAATDPLLCIHSHNQTTTQWVDIQHTATHGQIKVGLGGLIFPGMTATAGTAPAVSNTSANSCGTTAAALAGTDTTGVITVGATSGTSCTVTFVVAAPTRRQCWVNNETTGNLARWVYLTTTTGKMEGTFVGGDLVSYGCWAY